MLPVAPPARLVAVVAVVALVADVAVVALPVRAPMKVVDVTDVRPAIVVTVPPSETEVEPIVMLLFTSDALAIEAAVKLVPAIVGALDHDGGDVDEPPDIRT